VTVGAPAQARSTPAGLLAAAHPGPAAAVTLVAALLALGADQQVGVVLLVAAAVLAGHLSIGWGNDLLDLGRDRAVARTAKPLVGGRVTRDAVVRALAVSLLVCVVLSFATGWRSALVHLLLGIAWGHAYNLGLKATALSWLPYALAFGSLPAVASLAGRDPSWPPWWMLAAGATLGVGAHALNALPDLDDDERTGIRGLPHRLGEHRARALAAGLLLVASLLIVLGPAGRPHAWTAAALLVVAALTVVALTGRGRTPFRAAMAIAVLDVVLLVAAGR
jgi:4-hydroxybenzoate polyprenyltransferase